MLNEVKPHKSDKFDNLKMAKAQFAERQSKGYESPLKFHWTFKNI